MASSGDVLGLSRGGVRAGSTNRCFVDGSERPPRLGVKVLLYAGAPAISVVAAAFTLSRLFVVMTLMTLVAVAAESIFAAVSISAAVLIFAAVAIFAAVSIGASCVC